jgi:hypothetical protein
MAEKVTWDLQKSVIFVLAKNKKIHLHYVVMMTNAYCSASYLLYEEGREMIIRPHRRLSYYYSLSPNSGIICLEAHPCLPVEKCH